VACISLAAALVAQVRGAGAQTLDRTKPPKATAPSPFVFPKAQTRTLPNGLRVVLIEDHSLPLVAVRAVVGVDSLDDPVGKEGLFVLTAGMLREGTTSMTAEQLASAAAAIGNVVFPLRFTTITQTFDRSLELMADMLMRPSFPQAALDRVKRRLSRTNNDSFNSRRRSRTGFFSRGCLDPTIQSRERRSRRKRLWRRSRAKICSIFTARTSARTTRRLSSSETLVRRRPSRR
jgi:hypothetical protein